MLLPVMIIDAGHGRGGICRSPQKRSFDLIVLLDRSQESECKSVNRKPPRNRRKEYEVNDRPGNCNHSHCSDCDHSRLDPQQIRIKRHRSGSRMGMMSVGCPELFYRRPYRPKADRGKAGERWNRVPSFTGFLFWKQGFRQLRPVDK